MTKYVDFLGANIVELHIQVKPSLPADGKKIECGFASQPILEEMDKDHARGTLKLRAYAKGVLEVSVVCVGEFGAEDFSKDEESVNQLKTLSMGTLYPYCRAAIDQACGMAGMPSLRLPIISTAEVFAPEKVQYIPAKKPE